MGYVQEELFLPFYLKPSGSGNIQTLPGLGSCLGWAGYSGLKPNPGWVLLAPNPAQAGTSVGMTLRTPDRWVDRAANGGHATKLVRGGFSSICTCDRRHTSTTGLRHISALDPGRAWFGWLSSYAMSGGATADTLYTSPSAAILSIEGRREGGEGDKTWCGDVLWVAAQCAASMLNSDLMSSAYHNMRNYTIFAPSTAHGPPLNPQYSSGRGGPAGQSHRCRPRFSAHHCGLSASASFWVLISSVSSILPSAAWSCFKASILFRAILRCRGAILRQARKRPLWQQRRSRRRQRRRRWRGQGLHSIRIGAEWLSCAAAAAGGAAANGPARALCLKPAPFCSSGAMCETTSAAATASIATGASTAAPPAFVAQSSTPRICQRRRRCRQRRRMCRRASRRTRA